MDILTYIDIKTFLAFIVTLLLSYLYLSRKQKLPPGPFALPVVGNIIWLIRLALSDDPPFVKCLKDSKKYGDLIYVKLGKQGVLFVNGYDAIQEVLVQHSDFFSDRPHWLNQALKESLKNGRGMMWQSGEDWKKIRKFTLQSLRDFGVGKTSLEEKIFTEIDAATKVLRKTSGEPYDITKLAERIIANIIYGICFGRRHDYDDEKFHVLLSKLDYIFQRGNPIDLSSRLPGFILKLMGRDKAQEVQERLQTLNYIMGHISQEISEHEESFDGNNIRDFVDLYLKNKMADGNSHIFTDGNVFRVIMDLFLAGSETTSNTILWSIIYMMEYPDVQKRCQEEIHEKYGEQEIRWSHRNTLPYVEATLMEIQRLANIASFSLPHTNETEATVRGYTVPKNTLVIANLYSSNLDDRYWDEPEKFNPERFLENGGLKKCQAFMPFSIGPRICPGESLAKMEMFLVFCNFLQRFTFKREHQDVPTSFKLARFKLTSSPQPFKTRVIERY